MNKMLMVAALMVAMLIPTASAFATTRVDIVIGRPAVVKPVRVQRVRKVRRARNRFRARQIQKVRHHDRVFFRGFFFGF